MSKETEIAENDGQKPLELRDWDIKDFQNLLFAAFQPAYKKTMDTGGKVSGELEKLRKEADMDRQRADEMTELMLVPNEQVWDRGSDKAKELVDSSAATDVSCHIENGCDIDDIARRVLLANSSSEHMESAVEKQNRSRNGGTVTATVTEFAKATLAPYARHNTDIEGYGDSSRSLRQALSVEFRAVNDDRHTSLDMGGSLPILSSHGAFSDTQLSMRQNKWINERNKRACNFINSDQIEGFRGTDTLECLMEYIGPDDQKINKYSPCDRRSGDEMLVNAKKVTAKKNGKKEKKQNKKTSTDLSGGYCSEDGISDRINVNRKTATVVDHTVAVKQRVEDESEEIVENNDEDFIPVKNKRHVKTANKDKTRLDFKATKSNKTCYRSSTPPAASLSESAQVAPKRRRSVEEMGGKRGRRRPGRPKVTDRNSHNELTLPKEAAFFDLEESFPPLPSAGTVTGGQRQAASLTSSRDASPKKSYNEKGCSVASSPALHINSKCSLDGGGDGIGHSSYVSLCLEQPKRTTYASVISGNWTAIDAKGKAESASRQWVKSSSDKDLDKCTAGAAYLAQPTVCSGVTNAKAAQVTEPSNVAATDDRTSEAAKDGMSNCNGKGSVHRKLSGKTSVKETPPECRPKPSEADSVSKEPKDFCHVAADKRSVGRSKESTLYQFLANAWTDFVTEEDCVIETPTPVCS